MRFIDMTCHAALLMLVSAFLPAELSGQPIIDDITIDTRIKGRIDAIDRPMVTDAAFDRLLASGAANPVLLRTRMEHHLISKLNLVGTRCGLSDVQYGRIELAGRGDIARLVQTVEELRLAHVGTQQPDELAKSPAQDDIFRRVTFPSHQQFAEGTLFRKVARRQISDAQWVLYEENDRERQVEDAGRAISVYFRTDSQPTHSQQRAVARLFLDRYPQWRPISTNINFSEYVAARIAAELETELKLILDEPHVLRLQKQALIAKRIEPRLVDLGLWPIPGDVKHDKEDLGEP